MTIEGVKNIQTGVVKSIKVELDSEFTDGLTNCEMLIDEENKAFTVILFDGECYSLQIIDKDFIRLLIRELENKSDWLYQQLRDRRLDELVDIDATTEAMIDYIKESAFYKKHSEVFNSLEDIRVAIRVELNNNEPIYSQSVAYDWEEWFASFITDGLLPNAREMYNEGIELIKVGGDKKCRIFCEKVAPILAEVLKREYQLLGIWDLNK